MLVELKLDLKKIMLLLDDHEVGMRPSGASDSGTIKIRWIKIVTDNGTNRLFYAGTPTGSGNLQGGYFDTNDSNFTTWFNKLLASFNSADSSPTLVTYDYNTSNRRVYVYYEQIDNPAPTPPETPSYGSVSHYKTNSIT